jgi:hypothetical protein
VLEITLTPALSRNTGRGRMGLALSIVLAITALDSPPPVANNRGRFRSRLSSEVS